MKIKRDKYLQMLIDKSGNGLVKIITGIRRCGKSSLLFSLYKDYLISKGISQSQIIELQLDEIDNAMYRDPFRLNSYIKERISDKSRKFYIFIDEIQFCLEVPNPYYKGSSDKITFVDALLGLMKNKNADIYVTGSNSKMLSKGILTQFRGRGDEIHLYPLSFGEFFSAKKEILAQKTAISSQIEEAIKQQCWQEYCLYGGMPYLFFLNSNKEKSRYLKGLFEETYLKDIIERNGIRNDKNALDILLDFVSSSIGSLSNPAKLANRFKSESRIDISHSTVSRYLDYFCEAYLISGAKRYDIKGGKYFSTPLKYYFCDAGLRNARLNFRQIEENHIMENIIYNELLSRGLNVDIGIVMQSGIENGKRKNIPLEVDFVVNSGSGRCYIQSALNIISAEKLQQETRPFSKIKDSFKKIIITKDPIIPRYDGKGIFYAGITDFLLKPDLLML